MFTGIVSDIGRIRSVESRGDTRVVVETAYDTAGVDLGASIACSGVCLTVVDKGSDWFAVEVSARVRCGGRRRVLAYVKEAGGVRAIVEHLGLPTAGARLAAYTPAEISMTSPSRATAAAGGAR